MKGLVSTFVCACVCAIAVEYGDAERSKPPTVIDETELPRVGEWCCFYLIEINK